MPRQPAKPAEVRAADCPRRFTLLAAGGVRVRYACGAEVVEPDESAVDVAVLEERVPRAHAHRHLHLRHQVATHQAA